MNKFKNEKHQVVITGASKGIGKALADSFKNDYEVISISRTSGNFIGDINDKKFRDHIISNVNPFIFINNAGIYPDNDDISESIETNIVAAAHFTVEMLKKMNSGYIFNISSVSVTDYSYKSFENIAYASAKRMLSDFSQLAHFSNTKVKVCTIEPGFVMTDMANIQQRHIAAHPNDVLTRLNITPMSPNYIVDVIRWIMVQPKNIAISNIRITNR